MSTPVITGEAVPLKFIAERAPTGTIYVRARIRNTVGTELAVVVLAALNAVEFVSSAYLMPPNESFLTVIYEVFTTPAFIAGTESREIGSGEDRFHTPTTTTTVDLTGAVTFKEPIEVLVETKDTAIMVEVLEKEEVDVVPESGDVEVQAEVGDVSVLADEGQGTDVELDCNS